MKTLIAIAMVSACGFPEPSEPSPDAAPGDDAPPGSCCDLVAIDPSIANTGDTIALEGTFAAGATVTFPGGVAVAATVLGPHRATAVVPPGAGSGDLTVSLAGTTSRPLPFRRASFAIGMQPFQLFDEQVTGARQMPALVTGRNAADQAVVVTKGFVYVFGGGTAGGPVATIERARVEADGSLGGFETVPAMLATPRSSATAVVIGDFVYVLGGQESPGTVERAAIHADGSLDPFALVQVTLATPRRAFTASVIGSYLYVIGGYDGTSYVAGIERAEIAGDGTLGAFATTSGGMITPRANHATVVRGSSVYVIAGFGDAGALSSVEAAPIHGDGSLGAFAAVAALSSARGSAPAFALGAKLYVVGGVGTSGLRTDIEAAPIAADGTLGAFATVTGVALPVAQAGGAVIAGDHAYLITGSDATAGQTARIQRASLNASGTIGAPMGTARAYVQQHLDQPVIVVGSSLYVIGGSAPNNVEAAPIAADSAIGAFALTTSSSVPACLARVPSARIGSSVYLVGGAPCQNQALTSIYRAQIQADGTLGTFALASSHLVTGRSSPGIAIAGDNLYVVGGWYTGETTVERATINPDGSLGAFTTTGVTTIDPRMDTTTAVIGKFLYVFGGANTSESAPLNTIERIALTDDGSLSGSFSVTNTLNVARFFPGVAVVGGFVYVFGGDGGGLATAQTVERAAIDPDGSLGTFSIVQGLTPPGLLPTFPLGNTLVSCSPTGCAQLELQ